MSPIRYVMPLALLAFAACGQPAAPGGAAAPSEQAANAGGPCAAPAVTVAMGASANGEITATTEPYPANARYYCVDVPAGASSLTLELSGLSADLDLYVGHGSIESVQGVNVEQGETYEWKSNAFGNVDERVVINQPQPGAYYAEIVSYEGHPSSFQLSVR
jgi:hypothetical protein